MRRLLIIAVLLIPGSMALAQTDRNSASTNLSGTSTDAPVGHRQPRADQVPSEKNLSNPDMPVNREDAALDRKIKSICRGC